jgi:hypothetical protein
MNAAASMQGLPVRLRWDGFHRIDAAPADDPKAAAVAPHALKITLDNLLRRFVGEQWIAKRTEQGIH